jgi:hypothetical protein
MRPFSERLNDRLERQRRGAQPSGPSQSVLPGSDPKVEELAALAHRLQIAPHFQVDPGFAWRLESRILAHHAALSRRQAAATWGNWLFQPGRRMQFALGIVLVCLLLVATMGTFTAAAQVTNPYNPLYEVKRWVQHWQYPKSIPPRRRRKRTGALLMINCIPWQASPILPMRLPITGL